MTIVNFKKRTEYEEKHTRVLLIETVKHNAYLERVRKTRKISC